MFLCVQFCTINNNLSCCEFIGFQQIITDESNLLIPHLIIAFTTISNVVLSIALHSQDVLPYDPKLFVICIPRVPSLVVCVYRYIQYSGIAT